MMRTMCRWMSIGACTGVSTPCLRVQWRNPMRTSQHASCRRGREHHSQSSQKRPRLKRLVLRLISAPCTYQHAEFRDKPERRSESLHHSFSRRCRDRRNRWPEATIPPAHQTPPHDRDASSFAVNRLGPVRQPCQREPGQESVRTRVPAPRRDPDCREGPWHVRRRHGCG